VCPLRRPPTAKPLRRRRKQSARRTFSRRLPSRVVAALPAFWTNRTHVQVGIVDEKSGLIQNAVSSKRSKLEKNGVPQQCGDIILVLYDAYGYGDTEDAQIALRNVSGYDWFHSIFWAAAPFLDPTAGTPQVRPNELYPQEPGRVGSFLYTIEDRWKR
jgi:hypothetical protein